MTSSIINKIVNITTQIKKQFNSTAVKLQRETKNFTAKSIIGPIAKTFDLDEAAFRKFKGGLISSANQALCKNRYQQVSITPLADIASSSRILQAVAPTTYNMSLQLSTTDLSSDSSAIKMAISAIAMLGMTLVFAFWEWIRFLISQDVDIL